MTAITRKENFLFENKNPVQPLVLLRKQAGLSQSELARMAEVTPSAICMIEAGDREPKLSTALAIADALHVSIYALVGRSEYLPTEANGTYFSFLGCPFILTSSLAACLCL
ncbi:MAG: helix-turn-helix transcriptional regulator, partial [Gammaproteobacteria bacterium]|nr:helix-turn-helix transcriptional regulator [Gammaproteobacteria bacterium]